jgi:tetratricopeptide (TPR) repeat protein
MKKSLATLENDEYKELTLLAVDDYNRKDYQAALKKFSKMEKENYANSKIHELLAYIYLKLEDLKNAEKQYRIYRDMLRAENPEIVLDEVTFEDLVGSAGDIKEVEKDFKKLMKKTKDLDPIKDFEVPSKLSVLYMSNGQYDKAEQVLVEFKEKYIHSSYAS